MMSAIWSCVVFLALLISCTALQPKRKGSAAAKAARRVEHGAKASPASGWGVAADDIRIGQSAPLTEDGYLQVVEAKNNGDMMMFFVRVAKQEGFMVIDQDAFKVAVSDFSGLQGTESLKHLVNLAHKADWVGSFGERAEFSEQGYQKVANLTDDLQMATYMRRYVAELEKTIINETAFDMFVPYFSGTKSKHSLQTAREEILGLRSAVYEHGTDLGGPQLNVLKNPPRHPFGNLDGTAIEVKAAAVYGDIALNPALVAVDTKWMLGVALVLVAGRMLSQACGDADWDNAKA